MTSSIVASSIRSASSMDIDSSVGSSRIPSVASALSASNPVSSPFSLRGGSITPVPMDKGIKRVVQKTRISAPLRQSHINFICSALLQTNIRTRKDLIEKIDILMEKICQNPKIFKITNTDEENFELFKKSILAYNKVNLDQISLTEKDFHLFKTALKARRFTGIAPSHREDDLVRVTKSYDRLERSRKKIHTTSQGLNELLEGRDVVHCSHIILGMGDTGTTIWLEKYKAHHSSTREKLALRQVPDVLMIGEDFGSWHHDYTLAQPLSLLERGSTSSNPSDFLSQAYYWTNPYANARHVYQANLVNLAETEAPILTGTKILRIEKRSEHIRNWQSLDYNYRVIIATPSGPKMIYTNGIDICTGLGPARNGLVEAVISKPVFESMNQFNPKLGFTPIVDGNQFILTDTEEHGFGHRTIVIMGGGGTAAACYRKGFFGHDVRTEDLEFSELNKKNSVLWIGSRGFEAAGAGKLVTAVMSSAKRRGVLHIAELSEVRVDHSRGKLLLRFLPPKDAHKDTLPRTLECDQLVYAHGQEDVELRTLCREFVSELLLDGDSEMVPSVRTRDSRIHFFGAAAMAIKTKEYADSTWDWLHKENIGPDVGPGSMPPSRAQINYHLSKLGAPIHTVNVNMDSRLLIKKFLTEAGVPLRKIRPIIRDILKARKTGPGGFSRVTLQGILNAHRVNDKVKIRGHGHLVKKS